MQNPIEALLATRPVVILDGALATELEARGADLSDPLWSAKYLIEAPDMIRAVHLDYFQAGADVATTATYQATFETFARRGINRDAAEGLMREAVALARSARDQFWAIPANRAGRAKPLIAASVGPYGAMLADGSEYHGHYSVNDDTLREFHRPRLRVLADSGADLVACETLPCLREALVIARLLEELPGLTGWIGFACQDGHRNCEGEDIGACATALRGHSRIAAIGVNCTAPEFVGELLANLRAQSDKPLLAYPNSGEHYHAGTKKWTGHPSHESFADWSREWYAAGARLIGGCCRTTPQDIAALRRYYDTQCSEKFGSRFSKKARTPSTQS